MAIPSRKWLEEETTTLVLKIEVSPVLWDIRSTEYRNIKIKQKAIEELAMEFGVDGAEIQRKLHILCSQFQ